MPIAFWSAVFFFLPCGLLSVAAACFPGDPLCLLPIATKVCWVLLPPREDLNGCLDLMCSVV